MVGEPSPLVRYRSYVYDSARWQGFAHRPTDIVVTTPPKCGTTWTQMICALLVFQTPVLPKPLSHISPWLDMTTKARRDVVAGLEAQGHRRIIKTHTPLDGLPFDERVTYICVGRDPRDVALSLDNHFDNLDLDAVRAASVEAARIDGVDLPPPTAAPERSLDPLERFWAWVDSDAAPTESGSTLLRTLRHLESFWEVRSLPNVVLLHYDDLHLDLEGEMRRLAARLGIVVAEHRWRDLVDAATFEQMRRNSSQTVPNIDRRIWRDNERFFHRARRGEWRDLLGPHDRARYDERVRSLVSADLAAWVHRS